MTSKGRNASEVSLAQRRPTSRGALCHLFQWPTVVVEVGVSESYQKLKADAEWCRRPKRSTHWLYVSITVASGSPQKRTKMRLSIEDLSGRKEAHQLESLRRLQRKLSSQNLHFVWTSSVARTRTSCYLRIQTSSSATRHSTWE